MFACNLEESDAIRDSLQVSFAGLFCSNILYINSEWLRYNFFLTKDIPILILEICWGSMSNKNDVLCFKKRTTKKFPPLPMQ